MAEARDRRGWQNFLHPKWQYAKSLPTSNLDRHFVLNGGLNSGIRQGEVVVPYDGGGQIEEGGIMRPRKGGRYSAIGHPHSGIEEACPSSLSVNQMKVKVWEAFSGKRYRQSEGGQD